MLFKRDQMNAFNQQEMERLSKQIAKKLLRKGFWYVNCTFAPFTNMKSSKLIKLPRTLTWCKAWDINSILRWSYILRPIHCHAYLIFVIFDTSTHFQLKMLLLFIKFQLWSIPGNISGFFDVRLVALFVPFRLRRWKVTIPSLDQ